MLLEIDQLGEPILRQKCRPVDAQDKDLDILVNNMLETMDAAEGIGLAAPQVGVPIRLVVIDIPLDEESVTLFKINDEDASLEDHMPLIMINPEITHFSKKKCGFNEGCLSILKYRAEVQRPEEVICTFEDFAGNTVKMECDGLLSRAVQHEIDHLNGILFIDRISAATKINLKKRLAKLGLPVDPKKRATYEELD